MIAKYVNRVLKKTSLYCSRLYKKKNLNEALKTFTNVINLSCTALIRGDKIISFVGKAYIEE